jgi:hypothetical protein
MTQSSKNEMTLQSLAKADVRSSLAIASRSALRSIPLIVGLSSNATRGEVWEELALRIFQANLIPWAYCWTPTISAELVAKAKLARRLLLEKIRPMDAGQSPAVHAAAAAAACAALEPIDRIDAATLALQTVERGTFGIKARKRAFEIDCTTLFESGSPSVLIQQPLWYGPRNENVFVEHLKRLEDELLARGHDWVLVC